MDFIEINAVGNFETWEPSKLKELKDRKFGHATGQKLLFEDANVRLWEIELFPDERLPFREINMDYCWVARTDGLVITRSDNGSISLIRIKKGDSQYREYEGKAYMFDVQNIGEETLYFQVTEFKSEIEKEIYIIE
ncbi:MAG: hypothetical protein WBN39_08715 [Flavobacteriaceae bacterium]